MHMPLQMIELTFAWDEILMNWGYFAIIRSLFSKKISIFIINSESSPELQWPLSKGPLPWLDVKQSLQNAHALENDWINICVRQTRTNWGYFAIRSIYFSIHPRFIHFCHDNFRIVSRIAMTFIKEYQVSRHQTHEDFAQCTCPCKCLN